MRCGARCLGFCEMKWSVAPLSRFKKKAGPDDGERYAKLKKIGGFLIVQRHVSLLSTDADKSSMLVSLGTKSPNPIILNQKIWQNFMA